LTEKVNEMLDLFADAKNEVLSLFGLYDNLHAALNIVSIAACQKHYLRDYRLYIVMSLLNLEPLLSSLLYH